MNIKPTSRSSANHPQVVVAPPSLNGSGSGSGSQPTGAMGNASRGLKSMMVALPLALGGMALPQAAVAQSSAELLKEIEALKARLQSLEALAKKLEQAPPAPAAPPVAPAVEVEEFNRIRTKAEALEDQRDASGFKGFRVSGGLDVTYIVNRSKHTAGFAFLNNFSDVNGSGEVYSYDNSYQGLVYIDFQKELEGGAKWRLTLSPAKSTGAQYNFSNIVHEASASIPLGDLQTRFVVGQFPDISGYEPFLANFAGTNGVSSGLLFPGYANYFITKNLLFDFTAATFYTGVGFDVARGPWSGKIYLANFNAARYDVNNDSLPRPLAPTLIYNLAYAKSEFWGAQVTGYEGRVINLVRGGASRMDNVEVDAYYTKGSFNGNLQVTLGRQNAAAFNGRDSRWYGFSALASEKLTSRFTLAGRLDYLNNSKNGGGTFNVGNLLPTALDSLNTLNQAGGTQYSGDFYNGFGPGDPNDANYNPDKGANRTALAVSGTYRISQAVAFRGEMRYDLASRPAFYDFNNGTFEKSNVVWSLQTLVNF